MPRVVRQANNQKLFREVNERIAELSDPDEPDLPQSFFCECGRDGCNAMFDVPLRIYAIVRGENDTYVVLAGHQAPEHEETLTDHGEFLVVRTLRTEPSLAASAALPPIG